MGRYMSPKLAFKLATYPKTNIMLGVFYLKNLLDRFDGNYKLATVAYNMGPTWVRRRLNAGAAVGHRNHYFNKVWRNYHRLMKDQLVRQSVVFSQNRL
jgi:soluble lytic murein transglycosylase